MRITIDTEKKVVICPKTFWEDMRKTNEVLRSVGQNEIDHKERVKQYFEEAIQNDLVRPADVRKNSTKKRRRKYFRLFLCNKYLFSFLLFITVLLYGNKRVKQIKVFCYVITI